MGKFMTISEQDRCSTCDFLRARINHCQGVGNQTLASQVGRLLGEHVQRYHDGGANEVSALIPLDTI